MQTRQDLSKKFSFKAATLPNFALGGGITSPVEVLELLIELKFDRAIPLFTPLYNREHVP